jgi:toxin FitB
VTFLLDTNAVSEWTKPRPDRGLAAWLAEVDEDRIFLSVVTLAELRHGVERLPASQRRTRLDLWLANELPLRFEGRLLPVDAETAEMWGRLMARRDAAGRPMNPMDAFIAATANVRGLALVTRNRSDFQLSVPEIVDPWVGKPL